MPRRGWRGGRGRRAPGFTIQRFMEPCTLLLLQIKPRHGYDLTQALADFGMQDMDRSMTYRGLRSMEGAGLIASQWQGGNSGPVRRVYHLTPLGETYLAEWVSQLLGTDRVLHRFLDLYAEQMKENHDKP